MEFQENTAEIIAKEAIRLRAEIIKSVRLIGAATGLTVSDIYVDIEKVHQAGGGFNVIVKDVVIMTETGSNL